MYKYFIEYKGIYVQYKHFIGYKGIYVRIQYLHSVHIFNITY